MEIESIDKNIDEKYCVFKKLNDFQVTLAYTENVSTKRVLSSLGNITTISPLQIFRLNTDIDYYTVLLYTQDYITI